MIQLFTISDKSHPRMQNPLPLFMTFCSWDVVSLIGEYTINWSGRPESESWTACEDVLLTLMDHD